MHRKSSSSTPAVLPLLLIAAALSPAFAQQPSANPVAAPTTVPGFTVTITFSQKAMETLVARKETVIVAGYLSGFPKPGTPKRLVDHMDQIDMGEVKREVAPGAPAVFDQIKLDPTLVKWLDSQGPQVDINVFSGRKSSPNNLLDCGFWQDALSKAQGKTLSIACKLIGE
jgi:hypothetical protein